MATMAIALLLSGTPMAAGDDGIPAPLEDCTDAPCAAVNCLATGCPSASGHPANCNQILYTPVAEVGLGIYLASVYTSSLLMECFWLASTVGGPVYVYPSAVWAETDDVLTLTHTCHYAVHLDVVVGNPVGAWTFQDRC